MTVETDIRAALVTRINTVANRGNVYDYQRHSDDWQRDISLFGYLLGSDTLLRTWFISCERVTPLGGGVGQADFNATTYRYVIRGYFGVDDSASSEESALAKAIEVLDALNNAVYTSIDSCTVQPNLATMEFSYITWGGVLCHLAEITQEFPI